MPVITTLLLILLVALPTAPAATQEAQPVPRSVPVIVEPPASEAEIIAAHLARLKPIHDATGLQVRRLEVEMRRAGGARPEVVRAILADPSWQGTDFWSSALYRACRARLVDCNEMLPGLHGLEDGIGPTARPADARDAELIRREAWFQALPESELLALLRRALTRKRLLPDDNEPRAGEAASRIIDGRIVELYADAAKWARKQRDPGFLDWIEVRQAGASSRPGEAVSALIRRGVEADLKNINYEVAAGSHTEGKRWIDQASRAIFEYRLLNPPGGLEAIRGLVAEYPVARAKEAERMKQRDALNRQGLATPTAGDKYPRWELHGVLERPLIELIGDLGDRDTERAYFFKKSGQGQGLFGWPLAWDVVHVTELQLARDGKLAAEHAVTIEP